VVVVVVVVDITSKVLHCCHVHNYGCSDEADIFSRYL
jgi:hypothetical protein